MYLHSKRLSMLVLALLVPMVVKAMADHGELHEFEEYIRNHGKTYHKGDQEYGRRYENWRQTKIRIEAYHAHHPNASFNLRINHFSDLSPQELSARFRSSDMRKKIERKDEFQDDDGSMSQHHRQPFIAATASSSDTVDWRYASTNPRGVVGVTPVKNQGLCGACWGFSTIGAIEGAVAINTGYLNELSVQELIDCGEKWPTPVAIVPQVTQNDGCSGGDFEYSFQYAVNNGLQSSLSYRFIQRPSGVCEMNSSLIVSRISSYGQMTMCSTSTILQVVATRPVAAAIDASCDSFIHYGGGIFSDSCGSHLNHAVTIIGYGTDGTTPYWIVKNSWGTGWGEKGFGRIQRGVGTCGVSNMEEYTFYAAGGIAYVNGTAFWNDDAMAIEPKMSLFDRMLAWKHLTLVLSIALAILTIPTIVAMARAFKRQCHGGQHGSSRRRENQQPLVLEISDEELAAMGILDSTETRMLDWACPWCTYINSAHAARCEMCRNVPGREAAVVRVEDNGATAVVLRL